MRTDKTACILCSRNCGLEVEIDEGRLTRIRGDREHPLSEGYICQKAARLDHYQNHEDRLSHPLRRKSDGTFERVTWDEALSDIARRLLAIREAHGGRAFAFYGGGGQGNHLGGSYGLQLLRAMRSRFYYNALGQEKTGDFWVNGRLFGDQRCHITEDIDHADFVLFIGTNPWQAHGIRNARDAIKTLSDDPRRTMVVIDPRRTETAERADIHLALRPGTDAFLMAAMLAILVRDDLVDRRFLAERTSGYDELERALRQVPIEEFVRRADVPMEDVMKVVRGLASARKACVRVDLGIQQSLHSTLNSYLEKLLFLLTGNFGKEGGNNLHTALIPLIGHSSERSPSNWRTSHHGMFGIGKIYPPNILPAEIDQANDDRIRALIVDSSNPVMTGADSQAFERAFSKLELLVVVDVAMTETARLAHYVLPASSQLEKWEMTGFNLEFPEQVFHLRHPLFPAHGETLPEPEIYTRLLEHMGELPKRYPWLERVARLDRKRPGLGLYFAALGLVTAGHRKLWPRTKWLAASSYAPSILYRTLGPLLPEGAAAAALLLPLAHLYALQHRKAVERAGHRGKGLALGESLFQAILNQRSGVAISRHRSEDAFALIRHRDRRVHLAIPEMLEALGTLRAESDALGSEFPFVLIAGERRAYNANTIYRAPSWRRQDPDGALRIHPEDAKGLGLANGARARCRSSRGEVEVTIAHYDAIRRGVVTLPHGYGLRYQGGPAVGPAVNRLTSANHCDPVARTPFHKFVPVSITKL
ncbi:molybdopterin-dependent oxidoreductase [Pendulispora albinea]|uniref:Molybdopterin-dependent oxidoreductase n=1 Tax=Pendulispora albinea TaxID=2741071 RepID=A0ABZ2M1F3_9BACT